MPKSLLAAIFIVLFLPFTVQAERPPIPERKTQALETIQKNLKKEKKQQGLLEKELQNTKKELSSTRSSLVNIAKDMQGNEKNISLLEKRISKLGAEEKELTEKLEQDYGSIADLILALERMRRIPPESLIIRPGAPLQTAQTAMLLQSTLPTVHKRAEQLSKDLKHLDELAVTLKKDKDSVLTTKKELERKHADIQSLTKKRERLYNKTQSDYAQNKKSIERLSKEAKTLTDLLGKLEKEQKKRQAERQRRNTAHLYSPALPATGQAQLPVTGYISEAYGTPDTIGAISQGVTIKSRPGSLVTAPMGGVVRFTGTFKNYGNMVIIEHKGGYHSLISGFHKINTREENLVKAGEPIGQLPLTSSRGGRPALYYELRYKGQPVNPANKISGLKS